MALGKLEKAREKVAAKVAERDERIAEARRRAEDDRQDVAKVGDELVALYADPDELLKHARVVGLDEIEENEFNLNIPRYVDTFEPEPRVDVSVALKALAECGECRATGRADAFHFAQEGRICGRLTPCLIPWIGRQPLLGKASILSVGSLGQKTKSIQSQLVDVYP